MSAKRLLGGWTLNGIVTLSDGDPFHVEVSGAPREFSRTASRPDLKPGADKNPIRPGDPDRYIDPRGFALPPVGTLGTLGRNTLTSPGIMMVDFSLAKDTSISDRSNVQFRVEFFNLLNRPNFAVPSNRTVLDYRTGSPAPDVGRITRMVTTARQIQFGLRVSF